jgi:hypothetical protein
MPRRRELHYRPSLGQSPKLRDRPVREQWQWIERFFARCTDSEPFAKNTNLEISVRGLRKHRQIVDDAIVVATRLLGEPKVEPVIVTPDSAQWIWQVSPAQGSAAVEFLARGEPWTGHAISPAIVFLAEFNLRHPVSGVMLPHQTPRAKWHLGGMSNIIGNIGPHPWLKPHFVFPFQRVSAGFLAYLAAFSAELPFRLAPRHFRSIRPPTGDLMEHIGFLSPEDDERIRLAQPR